MKQRTLGLTAVELLVASALALIVMLAAMRLTASSRDFTQVTVDQASSAQDVQATVSLIADDVRRASVIHDSLTPPAWGAALTGMSRTLTLTMPKTSTCDVPQVLYGVIPRSNLTASSVDQWVRVPQDSANMTQQALLRVTRCGTLIGTVLPATSSRLVADYLSQVEFALARAGEATFSTSPTSATAGVPYQSVRITVVFSRAEGGRTVRVPRSGTLTTVAGSRVVD